MTRDMGSVPGSVPDPKSLSFGPRVLWSHKGLRAFGWSLFKSYRDFVVAAGKWNCCDRFMSRSEERPENQQTVTMACDQKRKSRLPLWHLYLSLNSCFPVTVWIMYLRDCHGPLKISWRYWPVLNLARPSVQCIQEILHSCHVLL